MADEKQIKFVVRIPMRPAEIGRIISYLRDGYQLVHNLEEQDHEQAKAQTA